MCLTYCTVYVCAQQPDKYRFVHSSCDIGSAFFLNAEIQCVQHLSEYKLIFKQSGRRTLLFFKRDMASYWRILFLVHFLYGEPLVKYLQKQDKSRVVSWSLLQRAEEKLALRQTEPHESPLITESAQQFINNDQKIS